ncbi:BrxA/BrxB family bacilliredoxin [Halobacillus litoralis]|uniref:BrxA/BrxB family bacilliredoxin n=1 Tax=Halobacillus litoralis TaxID=45668 RepID=UPI001CD3E920|nr:BrxA/BrxB family bacilliredoxin [Halobacillus litoralis]MCA0972519.1 BrxA/BrxB family bacilliredoxin [Halobacillus litoralis]
MNPYEAYMKEISQPMRDELTNAGFNELTTPEEVDEFISTTKGTSLVVVNSVCGCAAGLARPSARESLSNEKKPENLVTVFAGQDREATARMRDYFEGYEPSSPSMALLKDGQVVHFIPREEIEDHEPEEIITNLTNAYNEYC